jgi:hypothetical protein
MARWHGRANRIKGNLMETFDFDEKRVRGATSRPASGRTGSLPGMRRILCWSVLAIAAAPAHASLFSGEMLDKVADIMAIVVLIIVPVVAIVVFWLIHVLPEKIAHRRHHPQRDAITTLCLLSLVFGGLLWPLAWIWAYTKPIGYRVAYGTDKHADYYDEMAERHRAGDLMHEDIRHLLADLEAMEARGALPPKLRALKGELEYALQQPAEPTLGAAGKGDLA